MRSKKFTLLIVMAVGISIIPISISSAAAPKNQKFKVALYGDCKDSATEATFEEEKTNTCRFVVTFTPVRPIRTVYVQYKDEAGEWQNAEDEYGEEIMKKTDANKRLDINVPYQDADGVFYEFDKREYRIYSPAAKDPKGPEYISPTITINYVGAADAK